MRASAFVAWVLVGTMLGAAAQARVVCADTRDPASGGRPQAQVPGRDRSDAQPDSCAPGLAVQAAASGARPNYVFVTRARRALGDLSLDDPRLRSLTIGVVTGEGVAYSPPAAALAAHGLARNVRSFRLDTDSLSTRQAAVVDAVASGEVDVALVWRPLAEHLAAHSRVPLRLQPVTDQDTFAGGRVFDGPRRPPDAHAASHASSDSPNQVIFVHHAATRSAPEGRDDATPAPGLGVDSRSVGL